MNKERLDQVTEKLHYAIDKAYRVYLEESGLANQYVLSNTEKDSNFDLKMVEIILNATKHFFCACVAVRSGEKSLVKDIKIRMAFEYLKTLQAVMLAESLDSEKQKSFSA